jgi:uncharacterized membrane protein
MFEKWQPGQCQIVLDEIVIGLMQVHGKKPVEDMAKRSIKIVDAAIINAMTIKKEERG